MSIEFDCPYCQTHYRLKDELAGKRARCKNPQCRREIVIPRPRSQAEIEAAAIAVLTESAAEPSPAAPAATIPMTCDYCGHQWQEDRSKAGKNVLCPECRQRLRVPEPKSQKPADWRQQAQGLPSLARQNIEQLDGVVDTAAAAMVSGEALVQAGVTEIELEPRPLREKLLIAGTVVAVVGLVVGSIVYFTHRSRVKNEEQLLVEAKQELQASLPELSAAEAPLLNALMQLVEAKYLLHHDTPDKFKQAHALVQQTRGTLRTSKPSPVGHAIATECALLCIALGGDDQQVAQQLRLPWVPDTGRNLRPGSERPRTVYDELRQTLALIQGAEADFRTVAARRIALELAAAGQPHIAADLLPLTLFGDNERTEARAAIALLIRQRDATSELPARIAQEIVRTTSGPEPAPTPTAAPSVLSLCAVCGIKQAPPLPPLPPQGPIAELTRLAHVQRLLLSGDLPAALQVARREGPPEAQLKALWLCAEAAAEPVPALQAAQEVLQATRNRPNVRLAPGLLLRLAQRAAAAQQIDTAQGFAAAINDAALRTWCEAEIVRHRVAASTQRAEEQWMPLPLIAEQLQAGHCWGRMWIAWQNARLSGDRDAEKRAILGWSPAAVHAFGLAGIALGLQQR